MNTRINRIGGITAVLGGLYLLILSFIQVIYGGDAEDSGLWWQALPLMSLFLVIGAGGLLALAGSHKGVKVGIGIMGLGAVLLTIGLGIMAWFDNDNGWGVAMLGVLLLPLGFLLFGLFNRRAQVLRYGNAVPLIVGVFGSLLLLLALGLAGFGFTERQNEVAFGILLLTLAIGWIFLGVNMLAGSQDTAV
jgi:hypothetical protein